MKFDWTRCFQKKSSKKLLKKKKKFEKNRNFKFKEKGGQFSVVLRTCVQM